MFCLQVIKNITVGAAQRMLRDGRARNMLQKQATTRSGGQVNPKEAMDYSLSQKKV